MWYSSKWKRFPTEIGCIMTQVVEPIRKTLVAKPTSIRHPWIVDEREAERLPLALPVVYLIAGQNKRLEGHTTTVNLSSMGVHLTIPEMVSPQTPCQLDIGLPQPPERLSLRGRVVWCRVGRGRHRGGYEVGIAFVKPPTYDDPTFALLYRFIATRLLRKHLTL